MGYAKFTDEIREKFLVKRKLGFSVEKVAKSLGLTRHSIDYWKTKGKKDAEAGLKNKYTEFYIADSTAMQFEEQFLVNTIYKCIEKAFKGDKPQLQVAFNAAAWLLERKHSADYSKHINVTTKEDELRDTFEEMREQIMEKTIKEIEVKQKKKRGKGKGKMPKVHINKEKK